MALYRAFGLSLDSRFALPGMTPVDAHDEESVALRIGTEAELATAWSGGAQPTWLTRFPDGNVVRVDTGQAGDQRFEFGALATFWLSPEVDSILCAPRNVDDPAWQRFLLDTVLWWTALRRGYCLLHCCAVEHRTGVVAVASQMGGGKTTLGLELLRRGYPLFCDDALAVRRSEDGVMAEPGPPFMNVPAGDLDAGALGRPLASLNGETWLAVDAVSTAPRPLSALFLYGRGPDLPLEARKEKPRVLDLVPHLFLPAGGLDRARFDLLSDVAEDVPVFRLTAPAPASARAVADTVESALEESIIKV